MTKFINTMTIHICKNPIVVFGWMKTFIVATMFLNVTSNALSILYVNVLIYVFKLE